MSKERDILKSLLIQEELEVLKQLKKKLLSEEQFTKEVSKVLAGAVKRAQKEDKEFTRALSRPIKEGVTRAFSDNKQSIIDSLLPIMGQLIRKTVTNSIRQFVSDINRTIELGFSKKALKWRWQAFKSDVSFAEIVFQKTIRYQVTNLFVINRDNGLLIEHAGNQDPLKDKNALSAMLTALQDFIGDSLNLPESDLISAEINDNLYLISTGPKAYLASVIRGSPSERLKQKSQELIENIHAEFSDVLTHEKNYQNTPELEDYLRNHLVTKNRKEETKAINWKPWLFIIALLLIASTYYYIQRSLQFKEIQRLVHDTPGLYVHSLEREGDGFLVTGLLDPSADVSKLKTKGIKLLTKPYLSLEEEVINARIQKLLHDYPTAQAKYHKQTVLLKGKLSTEQQKEVTKKLLSLAGVENIDKQLQPSLSEELARFMKDQLGNNDKIKYKLSDQHLELSGTTDYASQQKLNLSLKSKFPQLKVTNKNLLITDGTEKLIREINQTSVNIPWLENKNPAEYRKLQKVINSSQSLMQRTAKIHLMIIGSSDCFGKKSDDFSKMRTKKIEQKFIQGKINRLRISTSIDECHAYVKQANDSLKNVRFKVSIE